MDLKLATRSARRTRLSGFTLIEVVVAMCVAGMVCVSLYAGIAMCFSSVESSRQRLRATQILTEKLEVIRLYNWDQINNPGFIPAMFTEFYQPGSNGNRGTTYTGTIAITAAPVHTAYTNTMRKVIVEVTWLGGVVTQQQRMETLISEHGIQNYIY